AVHGQLPEYCDEQRRDVPAEVHIRIIDDDVRITFAGCGFAGRYFRNRDDLAEMLLHLGLTRFRQVGPAADGQPDRDAERLLLEVGLLVIASVRHAAIAAQVAHVVALLSSCAPISAARSAARRIACASASSNPRRSSVSIAACVVPPGDVTLRRSSAGSSPVSFS